MPSKVLSTIECRWTKMTSLDIRITAGGVVGGRRKRMAFLMHLYMGRQSEDPIARRREANTLPIIYSFNSLRHAAAGCPTRLAARARRTI
jgi:hypothetical protein